MMGQLIDLLLTGAMDTDGLSLFAFIELLLTGTMDEDGLSLLALIVSDDGKADGTAEELGCRLGQWMTMAFHFGLYLQSRWKS